MGTTAQFYANSEMQPVTATLRNAATATADQAADNAAKVRQTVTNGGAHALRGFSRFVYTSSYVVSYAVVFSALFVAYSLPQENPLMHGLRDGGRAAKDALKSEE